MSPPAFTAPQHRPLCALAAKHLLRTREQGYPAAIAAGKITQADADRAIHLARCIVAQWRWIIDPARPACPDFDDATDRFGAYNFELVAELTRAANRQRAISSKRPADEAAAELADLYEALAWLQQGERTSSYARIVLRVDVERSAGAAARARAA